LLICLKLCFKIVVIMGYQTFNTLYKQVLNYIKH
jgi:hypothetical protein